MMFVLLPLLVVSVNRVNSLSATCNIPCTHVQGVTTGGRMDVPAGRAIVKPNTPISFSVKSDKNVALYVQDAAGTDIFELLINTKNTKFAITRKPDDYKTAYTAASEAVPFPSSSQEVFYWVWKNGDTYKFGLGCDPTMNELISATFPAVATENDVSKMQIDAREENAIVCFMDMIAYLPTDNGERCLFPFFRANCAYYSCTPDNHKQQWCKTVSGNEAWGNCEAIDGKYPKAQSEPVTTIAGCGSDREAECVFPFKYGCNEYNECTTINSANLWCGTESVVGKWGCCPTD